MTKEETIKDKVAQGLLKAAIDYYNAEFALNEPAHPKEWEEDRNKKYNEFVWHCQDYIDVFQSGNIDELNYDYL